MLLAGPLVGYFIGKWIDGKLGSDPYLMITVTLLGIVASAKETYKMIKQISDDDKDNDDNIRT